MAILPCAVPRSRSVLLGSAVLLLLGLGPAAGRAQSMQRVNVSSSGAQADFEALPPACSRDGRFTAFSSAASGLVAGDTNGVADVFVHDRVTGETSRVSVGAEGAESDGVSGFPAISADGRYVVFASGATNLVPADDNGQHDVFLRDRLLGTTELVSASWDGSTNDGESRLPDVSDDGRFVVFESFAQNLAPGDGDHKLDIFVRDRLLGLTSLESVGTDGTKADGDCFECTISADGRFLAFSSCATTLVAAASLGCSFLGDNIFLRDLELHTTTLVNVGPNGQPSYFSQSPRISADGRHVVFTSAAALDPLLPVASPLGNIFVRDLEHQVTQIANVDSSGAWLGPYSQASVSADGRFVAFVLLLGHEPVWLRDTLLGTTQPVSVKLDGSASFASAFLGRRAISDDGRFVAFSSPDPLLVPGDTNGARDAFLYDTRPFFTDLGNALAGSSGTPSLTAAGKLLAGELVTFSLASAKPLAPSALVIGITIANAPFKGGTLVPQPLLLLPFTTTPLGTSELAAPWPAGVPADTQAFLQWWILDPAGPAGYAASSALQLLSP